MEERKTHADRADDSLPKKLRDDASLVRAARDGNDDAFADLIGRYRETISRTICSSLGAGADAEDATQETFVLAYRHLGDLNSPERFSSWVRSIARNTARKWLGKRALERHRFVSPETMEKIADLRPEENGPAEHLTLERTKEAMKVLSAEDRTVTTLFYFLGMAQNVIAQTLRIPLGTVKSRLNRSRALLRKELSTMAARQRHEAEHESYGREVIAGMRGVIHWEKLLHAEGLDGWRVANKDSWTRTDDVLIGEQHQSGTSLEIGDPSWSDYELSVLITPIGGGNAQVWFRITETDDDKQFYMFDMLLGWQAVAVSKVTGAGKLTKLSVVNFPIELGREYNVMIAVREASLTTYIDGQVINQLTDSSYSSGPIALNVWQSKTAFRDPRIRHLA